MDSDEINGLRRAFQLPGVDQEYLDAEEHRWETVVDGGVKWLILHEFPIPSGYSANAAKAAFMIDTGYPDVQIDSVYFDPPIQRTDGKPIANIADQSLDGRVYQRWSRHRTSENPWRRGDDYVATHILLVTEWLIKELKRG